MTCKKPTAIENERVFLFSSAARGGWGVYDKMPFKRKVELRRRHNVGVTRFIVHRTRRTTAVTRDDDEGLNAPRGY